VVLRVAALALLLLLALVATLTVRTLNRLPDVTLYLVRVEPTHFELEPVHRRLGVRRPALAAAQPTEATVRAALEALAAGPTPEEAQRGLGSEVPPATEVRAVRFADGVVTVDLSADFGVGGGTASMLGRLHQVRFTAARPRGVEAVRLLVEGAPLVALGGEGLVVEQPWIPPERGTPRW
jgi:spore germination protein GerM